MKKTNTKSAASTPVDAERAAHLDSLREAVGTIAEVDADAASMTLNLNFPTAVTPDADPIAYLTDAEFEIEAEKVEADNAKFNAMITQVVAENTKAKAPKAAKPAPAPVDITPILAILPATVAPKHLDVLFNLNDGGKTVRRHLRKLYEGTHQMKTSWAWAHDDATLREVLGYFATRYTANLKAELK